MSKFDPVTETQACGCRTTTQEVRGKEPLTSYEPCLACALKNAGFMLVEAGKRLDEAAERQREEDAERAAAARVQAEGFIGGTD